MISEITTSTIIRNNFTNQSTCYWFIGSFSRRFVVHESIYITTVSIDWVADCKRRNIRSKAAFIKMI